MTLAVATGVPMPYWADDERAVWTALEVLEELKQKQDQKA